MTNTVDDDVKVWVSAKKLALEKGEFTLAELLEAMRKEFRGDPKKLERFVTRHCVANASGDGEPYFNYLFKVGPGKYRLFHSGDPIEYSHASAPTTPEVRRVPAEHKPLFAVSAKLAEQIRAVPTTTARSTPALRLEPAQPKVASATPKTQKAAAAAGTARVVEAVKAIEAAGGLKPIVSELDLAVPTNGARKTFFDQLFLELGSLTSRLEHARGATFTLKVDGVTGSATTLHNIPVRLPGGGNISHVADILVEIESPAPRTLFIDFLESTARPEEFKARAFDALHLRQEKKDRYAILVFIRVAHAGLLREQAEALLYPYDHFFGIEADDVKNASKYYALKQLVLDWVHGRVKARRD